MAISSVSRTFHQTDPVMEADLELISKVNLYQQAKFDEGAAALQNEVNNWAMMAQIAKPELKQYANTKLVNLVNGINNIGGVNLSDVNNVNQLKSLGYNISGDKRIMDGVVTTQKMRALQANSQSKLSGKDASKYDATVASYLMKGYQEWASDGDVNNTRYDGPVDLPQGNMNTINEKVRSYLKELTPDSDATPSGDLQKSYGYFQVEGKWLKGNRIQEAINAVTDENDALIFKAHGWSALQGDSDAGLVSKLGVVYDNAASGIKDHINYLQAELNNTTDAAKRIEFDKLIAEQKQALATNEKEKGEWYSKKELASQEREGIQSSLYKNAWQSNIVNSYSYGQQKRELKSNMPLIFHDRMELQAQQFAKTYDLNVKKYELDKMKTEFDMEQDRLKNSLNISLNGGLNLPLTQEANTTGTNQQASPEGFIDKINSKYFGLNAGYYQYMYNLMGANDTKGRFTQVNGAWKPKPEYNAQIEKEMALMTSKLDNYSNLSDAEKKAINLPVSDDELKDLFNIRSQINTYGTYKKMAENKETEIINNAISKGLIEKDWRNVQITVGDDKKTMTIVEALALKEAGVLSGDVKIGGINESLKQKEGFKTLISTGDASVLSSAIFGGKSTVGKQKIKDISSLADLVAKYRKDAEKSYQNIGGKMYNSFSVPIPFISQPKPFQEIVQKQLFTLIGNGEVNDINPLNGKIEMDFKTGKPQYWINVQSGKGKKLSTDAVNVTDMVTSSPGSGIAAYFPTSDVSLVWGLQLNDNGATPFSQKDSYRDALRTQAGNYPYQISKMPNALNGTVGLKVKIALPTGDGKVVEVNVKNPQSANSLTFPSSIEAVQRYLDDALSTPELKQLFYQRHGIPMPK